MHRRIHTHGRTERGASAVEFALVVIPLLMVIAGIVNFGFAFAQQLSLDNAVRAGARAGVVDTGNDPLAVTKAQWESTAIARDLTSGFAATYPGLATCEGSTFGQTMAVKGSVTTKFLVPWPLPGSLVPKTVTLTSKAEFQCEYQ